MLLESNPYAMEPIADAAERPSTPKWRAPLLGLILCVPACYATANLPQSSMFSLLAAPVAILMILAGFNALLAQVAKRSALSPAEMAIVFAMISTSAVMAGEWTFFMHATVHQLPYIAPGNPAVKDSFMTNLPDWLIIKDLSEVQDIQTGGWDVGYVWSKIALYAPKYLAWGALIVSVALACLCINSLLRKAWTEQEKLAYPIIQLPLALSNPDDKKIWGGKGLWIAFGIMFAIDLLAGLNYLYPNLPRIPVKQVFDTAPFLRDAPWSSMGEFNIGIYPFLAAIGLFMPTDLLASLLVFFLLRKATHVILGMGGIGQSAFSGTYFAPGAPYFEQLAWGGVLALFVAAMYYSRGHLKMVWREIRSGAKADDGGWSSRAGFLGLLACTAVVLGFGLVGGLPIHIMLVYFGLFLVFSVVLARLRAQLGPPTHEFAYFGPSGLMSSFAGTAWMNDRQAVWISQVFLFMNRIARTHPGPTQLEALKMGKETGASTRTLLWCIVLATAIGFGLAYWFYLTKAYRLGAPIGATDAIPYYQGMQATKHGPESVGMIMTGVGFIFASGLEFLRMRFPAFWLHPAGFVLGATYGIDYYWFGLLLALIAKVLVQRYKGIGGYEKLKQVAIGLMLAEYAAEAIWMAIALTTKQSTYTIGFNDRSLGIQ